MNVLVATGLNAPEIGGPATHVALLEKLGAQYGLTLTVVPFSRVRAFPRIVRHVVYTWLLLMRASRAEVIYALDPVSVGIPALIVATILRKPLVVRIVGDYAWEQGTARYGVTQFLDQFVEQMHAQPRAVRMLGRLERLVAKRAACVIVPSEYLKSIIVRWGVPESSIRVVYNAFLHEGLFDRATLRARFGYHGPVITSAGRMVSWKGFRTLIEVVAALAEEYPQLSLVLAGDGPDQPALEALVRERGLTERVRFMGRLAQSELHAHIAASDVFVLNTAYEGLSHLLLEVMALGVPIITTRVGGNSELITHHENGVLIAFDDRAALAHEIRTLLRDHATGARYGAASREKVAQFSEERTLTGVRDVLEQVLASRV